MPVGRRIALLAPVLVLLVTAPTGSQAVAPDPRPARVPAAPVTAPAADLFRSPRSYSVVAAPVRLRIPAARVDTALQPLGRNADSTIAVPSSPAVAGWYSEGPRPGQAGPAVIVGHVDSDGGPAVFFRIDALPRDAAVHVDRADGSTVTFRVTAVSRVPKDRFPTDLVYSPTLQPSLQLVTCGGSFDQRVRSYRDNVIVYTVPA